MSIEIIVCEYEREILVRINDGLCWKEKFKIFLKFMFNLISYKVLLFIVKKSDGRGVNFLIWIIVRRGGMRLFLVVIYINLGSI